jgi:hypothetical protein
MSRSRSPTGTKHLRIPKENADVYTRLTCLLLNTLQRPPTVPNQKLPPADHSSTGEYISQHKFWKNDREVRKVGLRHLPNIKDIKVGVKWEQCVEHGYKSYFLVARAWISFLDEDPARYEEDYWTAPLMFRWNVKMGEKWTREYMRISEGIEWERMLDLLERYAKVNYNQCGEERWLDEAEHLNGMLDPAFPEMPRVTFD